MAKADRTADLVGNRPPGNGHHLILPAQLKWMTVHLDLLQPHTYDRLRSWKKQRVGRVDDLLVFRFRVCWG